MSLHRGNEGSEPVGRLTGPQEEHRVERSTRLATGTLACPDCDAPVALPAGLRSPADPLGCPFCPRTGAVRDFLSLEGPPRPARVAVRVVARPRTLAPARR